MCSNMGGKVQRSLFKTLFACFIGLVVIGLLRSDGISEENTITPGRLKYLEVREKGKHDLHPDLDPYYMSERRVPNGPDPIHNRKAGNKRRPPGQA